MTPYIYGRPCSVVVPGGSQSRTRSVTLADTMSGEMCSRPCAWCTSTVPATNLALDDSGSHVHRRHFDCAVTLATKTRSPAQPRHVRHPR